MHSLRWKIGLWAAEVTALAGIGFLAWNQRHRTVGWSFTVGGLALALTLFVTRGRHRAIYGLAEISFGLHVLALLQSTSVGFSDEFFSADFAPTELSLPWAAALAAIYIIVRGLDNVWSSWKHLPPR